MYDVGRLIGKNYQKFDFFIFIIISKSRYFLTNTKKICFYIYFYEKSLENTRFVYLMVDEETIFIGC
jgi:hypothetical protein